MEKWGFVTPLPGGSPMAWNYLNNWWMKSQRHEFFFFISGMCPVASRWFIISFFSFLSCVIFLIPLFVLKFSFFLKFYYQIILLKSQRFKFIHFIYLFLFIYLFIFKILSLNNSSKFRFPNLIPNFWNSNFPISKIPIFTFIYLLLLLLFCLFFPSSNNFHDSNFHNLIFITPILK